MARKRLSDLLREEAQKPTEGESSDAPTPEAPAKDTAPAKGRSPRAQAKPNRAASTKSSATSRAKATAPAASEPSASPTLDVADVAEPPAVPVSDETAALKGQLTELQSALTAAQRREDLLKRQVLDLETTLDTEKERSQQLQQELETTKLQNRPLVSLPNHPTTTASASKAEVQPSTHPVSIMEAELEKILQQPVTTDAPYADLTNDDIGWMD